jgi:hypothetical protein
MAKELTIELKSVKHPERVIRGNSYLFNMTDTELEKAKELMEKYNYNMRELLSTLLNNAK